MADRIAVITKVRSLRKDERAEPRRAERAIEASVIQSMRRLQMQCLPIVLFHQEADAVWLPVLEKLKAKGMLRYSGVSCDHDPASAQRWLGKGGASALQLPCSVLDRRHLRGDVVQTASGCRAAVFVRSVFLQGLLLMPERDVPESLRDALPARRRLADITREAGISLAELAVRYVLSHEGVTCVVIGAETPEQVAENVSLIKRGPLGRDVRCAIEAVSEPAATIVTPRMWPKSALRPKVERSVRKSSRRASKGDT
jgi:aryl-alcohol dehydrogenase-like predicted oxidoreductase